MEQRIQKELRTCNCTLPIIKQPDLPYCDIHGLNCLKSLLSIFPLRDEFDDFLFFQLMLTMITIKNHKITKEIACICVQKWKLQLRGKKM